MFEPAVPNFLQVPAPTMPIAGRATRDPGVGAADAVEAGHPEGGPRYRCCAVIAEPVMGAGGVIVPPHHLLPAPARDLRLAMMRC